MTSAEETVIATYRVRADAEIAFRRVLDRHWSILRDHQLVTNDARVLWRSVDEPPTYVEIFTWVVGGAARAHDDSAVREVWGEMGATLEQRGDRPPWEFPHYSRVEDSV